MQLFYEKGINKMIETENCCGRKHNKRGRILAISPHCDDINEGAGGLILKLLANQWRVDILYCVKENHEVIDANSKKYGYNYKFLQCPDGKFYNTNWLNENISKDYSPTYIRRLSSRGDTQIQDIIKRIVEEVHAPKNEPNKHYDMVLVPSNDYHGDHKLVNQACLSALRSYRNSIVLYESPRYTNSNWCYDKKTFSPNSYLGIDIFQNQKNEWCKSFLDNTKRDKKIKYLEVVNTMQHIAAVRGGGTDNRFAEKFQYLSHNMDNMFKG